MTPPRQPFRLRLAYRRDEELPPGESTAVRDREQFRLVMLPHLDAAYSFARYLARDATAAEDIVQEAFVRAVRAFSSCRGNEKAWLFAIVRNCFLDWAKANGRHRAGALENDDATDHSHPEAILQRLHDVNAVRATVAALPEPFREAVVLRELEELSYREIATLTAVPIGTVMSRLARGRQMLAAMLTVRGA